MNKITVQADIPNFSLWTGEDSFGNQMAVLVPFEGCLSEELLRQYPYEIEKGILREEDFTRSDTDISVAVRHYFFPV